MEFGKELPGFGPSNEPGRFAEVATVLGCCPLEAPLRMEVAAVGLEFAVVGLGRLLVLAICDDVAWGVFGGATLLLVGRFG
jgi:hypothetical protein